MEIRVYIGCIGAGKDYTCEKECTVKVAFADKLREDIWQILGWKPKDAKEYDICKGKYMMIPIQEYGPMTWLSQGRQFMCNYADLIKESLPNYFTDHLLKRLKVRLLDPTCWEDVIGITDCRYPEEVKALLQFERDNYIKVTFVHCDFRSERYTDEFMHSSEAMAQQFVDNKYSESEFNLLIREIYGEKED